MEYLYLFIVLLVVHDCVGATTTTMSDTFHTTDPVTTTGQTDHINTTTEHDYSTQQTSSDIHLDQNGQIRDKTYKEMNQDELAHWFTGIQSTFINKVKEIPKTSPIIQKPTTHSNSEQITTTAIVPDSLFVKDNETVETASSLLSQILSTGSSVINGEKTTTIGDLGYPTTSARTSTETMQVNTDTLKITTETNIINNDITTPETTTRILVPTGTSVDQKHDSQTSTETIATTKDNQGDAETVKDFGLQMNISTGDSKNTGEKAGKKTSKNKQFESLHRKRYMEVLRILNVTGRFNMSILESFDPDLIPPEELARFLDSIHGNDTHMDTETISIENFDIVQKVISMDKFMVAVCTISIAIVLFIFVICVIRCRKIKPEHEPQNESMKSDILQLQKKSKPELSRNGSVNSDTFMGIPTNNAIWRDIQSLPETASSVMPESKVPEASKF